MKHYYVRHGRRVNGNNTAATAALHCLSVCLHPPPTLAWRGKGRRETSGAERKRWKMELVRSERVCESSEQSRRKRGRNKCVVGRGRIPKKAAISGASLSSRRPVRPCPCGATVIEKRLGMGSLPMIEQLESERYQVSGGGSINLTRIKSPCLNNSFRRAGRERREGPEGR